MSAATERRAKLSDRVAQWERLVEIRLVEDRIQQLWNEGVVRGTTHLSDGQEAVAVGLAAATEPGDIVTCTYRGHAMALALGTTPVGVIGEVAGRSAGCVGGLGGSMHLYDRSVGLFPTFAVIGAGIPIAVGAALSAKTRKTGGAAVAVFGDGTTNIGAFHESLNLASIWSLPVVFVIENNLYGEYSRVNLTTAVSTLADRASAYSMPGRVVDGQDVDAVRDAISEALAFGRSGGGPTLLEMQTYRYTGHSKTDPAKYRPAGELDAWLSRDPIDLFAERLISERATSGDELADARARLEREVAYAAETALASAEPDIAEMFRNVSSPASER